jgi:hypothetical protein
VRNSLKRIETLESEQRALYAEGENFNKESWQLLNVSMNNVRVSYDFIDVFQDEVSFFGMGILLYYSDALFTFVK